MRRVDERLGLAVLRASLSGRTLVTYARDHVTVRTPSRPSFADGNTLDLEAGPAPGDLAGWLERFQSTIGVLGVQQPQLRWEEPIAGDATAADASGDAAPVAAAEDVASPEPELIAAAAEHGLTLRARVVLLLDALTGVAPSPAHIEPVAAPTAAPGGPVDRRWYAATVLYRYDQQEPDSSGWRDWDQDEVAWRVEVQRELALEGRARVWLATRHGAPVGRVTLTHDRQGLVRVDDLVVHPVHRGRSIGAALGHGAIAARLELDPDARVGAVAVPGSAGLRLARRVGLVEHAVVWTAR